MRRIAALSRDEWIDADAIRRALGEASSFQPDSRDAGIDAAVRARLERMAIEEPGVRSTTAVSTNASSAKSSAR
jgi:two-component system nitrogen regulation response regulator GlnG